LIDPNEQAKSNRDYCLSGLCRSALYGAFNILTGLDTFALGEVGNRLIAGLLGAGAAMGAFFRWWSRL